MGALIAFELERLLEDKHHVTASMLFVAGARAPHLSNTKRETWTLSDSDLIEEIRGLGGTPSILLSDANDWLLPIIRADFQLVETYQFEHASPLRCPILAMRGIADTETTAEQIRSWSMHTVATFSHSTFEGDHFFVRSSQAAVLRRIAVALQCVMTPVTSKQNCYPRGE
jgi:medium-chain acyl-[acyl-carrier-protein] hydrolase